jgi:hypothetical protein
MRNAWPFDQPRNCAAISVRSVVLGAQPILFVSHDAEDRGWQFLDGGTADLANALVVAMEEIIKGDPSLLEIADLPPGWSASRATATSPWVRTRKEH